MFFILIPFYLICTTLPVLSAAIEDLPPQYYFFANSHTVDYTHPSSQFCSYLFALQERWQRVDPQSFIQEQDNLNHHLNKPNPESKPFHLILLDSQFHHQTHKSFKVFCVYLNPNQTYSSDALELFVQHATQSLQDIITPWIPTPPRLPTNPSSIHFINQLLESDRVQKTVRSAHARRNKNTINKYNVEQLALFEATATEHTYPQHIETVTQTVLNALKALEPLLMQADQTLQAQKENVDWTQNPWPANSAKILPLLSAYWKTISTDMMRYMFAHKLENIPLEDQAAFLEKFSTHGTQEQRIQNFLTIASGKETAQMLAHFCLYDIEHPHSLLTFFKATEVFNKHDLQAHSFRQRLSNAGDLNIMQHPPNDLTNESFNLACKALHTLFTNFSARATNPPIRNYPPQNMIAVNATDSINNHLSRLFSAAEYLRTSLLALLSMEANNKHPGEPFSILQHSVTTIQSQLYAVHTRLHTALRDENLQKIVTMLQHIFLLWPISHQVHTQLYSPPDLITQALNLVDYLELLQNTFPDLKNNIQHMDVSKAPAPAPVLRLLNNYVDHIPEAWRASLHYLREVLDQHQQHYLALYHPPKPNPHFHHLVESLTVDTSPFGFLARPLVFDNVFCTTKNLLANYTVDTLQHFLTTFALLPPEYRLELVNYNPNTPLGYNRIDAKHMKLRLQLLQYVLKYNHSIAWHDNKVINDGQYPIFTHHALPLPAQLVDAQALKSVRKRIDAILSLPEWEDLTEHVIHPGVTQHPTKKIFLDEILKLMGDEHIDNHNDFESIAHPNVRVALIRLTSLITYTDYLSLEHALRHQ